MNWVDIVILVVWVLAALWGVWNGLLRTVFPLVMVVVALLVASRFAGPVGNIFSPFASSENVQTIAGFITICVVVFILAILVGLLLRALLNFLVVFGLVDRLAGMVLGLLVGFVLLSGVLAAAQKFPVGGVEEDIAESTLGPFLADQFDVVVRTVKLIPGDWDDRIRDTR